MRRSSLDKLREDLRLQQVYNTLLRYGYDTVLDRTAYLGGFRHAMQSWVWRMPKGWEEPPPAVKLRLMLEELGPTYVKIGQIVSSQASVLPVDMATELSRLQDAVPPFPSDQVRERIVEELGGPPEELYASFEPEPFAAASTAQVHRATLHDGTLVAVKVQRPDIQTKIRADLGILLNAARVVSARSETVRSLDISGMLEQFSSGVLEELDYRGEAYNAMRLADNMHGLPGIHVPRIYADLSTSRVITQEFVVGVKVSDVAAIEAAGLDRDLIARNALRALIKQLPVDGFFHADPHPGNLLLNLDTGVLTFIDLGMMGELDLQKRLRLGQLMIVAQQGSVEGMADALRGMSTPFKGDVDEKAFRRDFARRMGRYMSRGRVASFGEVANEGFELLRIHGLRLDADLTLAVKALVQTESVARALSTDSGLLAEGVPLLRDMALEAISGEKLVDEAKKQLMGVAGQVAERIPTLSEATTKWLDQYQKGRFEVTVDTSQLSKEVTRLTRLGREIVIAVMLVGMLVGSAVASYGIATVELDGPIWNLLERIAPVGFVLSLILSFLIVLRLTWRWLRGASADED
ncbi:MAG: ABC1 kinase family protein [Deltaproteobacteria bacterium]